MLIFPGDRWRGIFGAAENTFALLAKDCQPGALVLSVSSALFYPIMIESMRAVMRKSLKTTIGPI